MQFGAFLIFSLLFTSYCVDSKPIQPKDDEYLSALKDLKAAVEFLESLKTKLETIDAAIDAKSGAEYVVGILIEMIRLGPSKAIEIEDELSEIVQLINQASEVQASNDDLKNVLQKVAKAEDVINQTKDQQRVTVLQHIKFVVDILNEFKTKVDANPDHFLEQLKLSEELIEKLHIVPKYLSNLIKPNSFDIIEQLWNADLAVNSVKATYPSEAARLETIIRGTADKFYALRRELKRLKMEIALTKAASINPTDDIVDALMEIKESDTTLDSISLGKGKTITEGDNGLDEIRETMLQLGGLLEGAYPWFLENIDDIVEQIKAKFPEGSQQLGSLANEVKLTISELKTSIKTVVDKIELDISEGVHTDCLYTEMFARTLKEKMTVFHECDNQIRQIFGSVLSELPDGNTLKTNVKAFEEKMDDMGQFDVFLRGCTKAFFKTKYVFLMGADEIDDMN